jgi:superfamily II DNA/RNA helicase
MRPKTLDVSFFSPFSLTTRPFNTPLCVVLTPGRELAEQIFDVADKLCAELNVSPRLEQGGHIRYAA